MSNHLGDTNKMVRDTPRTAAVWELFATDTTLEPDVEFSGLARQLERELNAANERIRLLISERDTAQAYADQKWKLRREFHDLFGTDDVEQGMTVVREMKDRIKRLEEAVEAYRTAYTPDGHVAPHDCFATGPKTGNPIEDLVACPGCWAERKAKEDKL